MGLRLTIFNILGIFVMTIIVYFILECIVRLFFPTRPAVDVAHPILNHTWRPNFSWEDEEGNATYYNQQGWLQKDDISLKKPENIYRIFYVGDSNTEGTRPAETSMPSRIRQFLNETFQNSPVNFEVINTGTSSYSFMIYYLLIKFYILPFNPNLVVLNIDMTDVFDDYLYRDTAQYDASGNLIACPPGNRLKGRYIRTEEGLLKLSWKGRIYNFLKIHSRLFTFIKASLEKLKKKKETEDNEQTPAKGQPGLRDWCLADWSQETEALVSDSLERLRLTIKLLKSEGVKVAVTGIPHRPHFIEEKGSTFSTRPFEAIQMICREENIPYIDTYGGWLKRMDKEDIPDHYRETIHFNREGYRIWAEIQMETLLNKQNDLLPWDSLKQKVAA